MLVVVVLVVVAMVSLVAVVVVAVRVRGVMRCGDRLLVPPLVNRSAKNPTACLTLNNSQPSRDKLLWGKQLLMP